MNELAVTDSLGTRISLGPGGAPGGHPGPGLRSAQEVVHTLCFLRSLCEKLRNERMERAGAEVRSCEGGMLTSISGNQRRTGTPSTHNNPGPLKSPSTDDCWASNWRADGLVF